MFVLRDQCMPKKDEKFQEQMVSKIKVEFNNLKKNLDLDYQ